MAKNKLSLIVVVQLEGNNDHQLWREYIRFRK